MAHFSGNPGAVYNQVNGINMAGQDFDLGMPPVGDYAYQSELDLFANTQFFDFDMAEVPEQSPTSHEGEHQWPMKPTDYVNDNYGASGFRYNHNGTLPSQLHHPSSSSNTSSPGSSTRNTKAKIDTLIDPSNPASVEEASRLAAEEDKRRRNTAASARFRVKKKQREQALEKTAKDMTDRVSTLEARVEKLEMENKLLKDLLTEKSGKEIDAEELRAKVEVVKKEAEQRSGRSRGVKASDAHGEQAERIAEIKDEKKTD